MVAEMAKIVDNLEEDTTDLTQEERTLLVRAYRHAITARRKSLDAIDEDQNQTSSSSPLPLKAGDTVVCERIDAASVGAKYRGRVESELRNLCADVVDLVDDLLLPCAQNAASVSASLTLRGDQFRYVAEACHDAKSRTEAARAAAHDYTRALTAAQAISPAHPTRLAAALNFALLCAHVLDSPVSAHNLAVRARDDAANAIHHLQHEDDLHDAHVVLHTIEEYIDTWKLPDRLPPSTERITELDD